MFQSNCEGTETLSKMSSKVNFALVSTSNLKQNCYDAVSSLLLTTLVQKLMVLILEKSTQ